MSDKDFLSVPELAKILGVSRIAVYRRVRKGQIKATKIGRAFAIPRDQIANILGTELNENDKRQIDKAVTRTVKEYGQVLKLLGKQ